MNKQTIQTTYTQLKRLAAFLLLSLFISNVLAQEVRVTVGSRFNPMPPQAMLYANDPGRFFHITLQNRSDRPITLFLGIELEKQGLRSISLQTPVRFSPSKGITLQPGQVRQLQPAELKELFRYINLNDVRLNGAIMTNFTTGKQPLLPEGYYSGRVVAYEVDHDAEYPLVLSDPRDGNTSFWVCYSAKAPQIIAPMATEERSVDYLQVNETTLSATGYLSEIATNNNVAQLVTNSNAAQLVTNSNVAQLVTNSNAAVKASRSTLEETLMSARSGQARGRNDKVRYKAVESPLLFVLRRTTRRKYWKEGREIAR